MLYACRGLPVERLSRLQILIAYWGFGLHWGDFTIYSLFLLSVHHLMFTVLLIHLIVFAKQSSAYEGDMACRQCGIPERKGPHCWPCQVSSSSFLLAGKLSIQGMVVQDVIMIVALVL